MKAFAVVNKKGKIVVDKLTILVYRLKKDALSECIKEGGETVVEVEITIKGGKE